MIVIYIETIAKLGKKRHASKPIYLKYLLYNKAFGICFQNKGVFGNNSHKYDEKQRENA